MYSTRSSREIRASPADVYRAMVDGDLVARWRVPDGMTGLVHEFDAREGGRFRISLTYDRSTTSGKTAAQTDTYHGHFVQLSPDAMVVEVSEFETDDPALRGEMTMTTTLTPTDAGTRVEILHEGIPDAVARTDNETGTQMALAKLARLVEGQDEEAAVTEPSSDAQSTSPAPQTGYAPVNGLQMYYEIHGSGGTPLLLLHGGLFNIDLQFGGVLPGLAAKRQVIAADFQAHGRTGDIDRPLSTADLASDVVGLLQHLGIPQVDVFGFSVGGAVALYLALNHPELLRKLVVSSASFHPDGDRKQNADAVGELTVDMIAGTPMELDYLAKSPNPDKLQDLLDKLGTFDKGSTGWSDAEIQGIAAPTLITVGDCDAVTLEHAVRFLRLRGGDVNGDFVGVPASQLAVFPGTTHFFGMARTALVLDVVTTFLDAPEPASWAGTHGSDPAEGA